MESTNNNNDVVISFKVSDEVNNTLENHIDITRISLRKRHGVKFSKKQMYEYLLTNAISEFNVDEFIKSIETKKK